MLCVLALLADRYFVLDQFAFRYVDDDQAIMWYGAEEMAHGRFHEPCFYGQRYNTMLEGLAAVPALWAGIKHELAVPLMTSVLALFPFLLLAALLAIARDWTAAGIVLLLPVAAPPEWTMITSMPRGFVSGIFLSAFMLLPLFTRSRLILWCLPTVGLLAVFANPNALLVVVPVGLLVLLDRRTEPFLPLMLLAGALPGVLLYYAGKWFYDLHPTYEVHFPWKLSFKSDDIEWARVDGYLGDVLPFFWGRGSALLVLGGSLMLILMYRRRWHESAALLLGLLMILASFGVNKVHDGIASIFYPWARMFLAVPFLLAVFASRAKLRLKGILLYVTPAVALAFVGLKRDAMMTIVQGEMAPEREKNLAVLPVAELRQRCPAIADVARKNEARLLVIGWGSMKHMDAYACPCLEEGFPLTVEPELDRRTWHLRAIAGSKPATVLFSDYPDEVMQGLSSRTPAVRLVSRDPLLYVLKGNMARMDTLLGGLGMGLRPY